MRIKAATVVYFCILAGIQEELMPIEAIGY
jgi:hypothetical protein